jgi:hypothetical protein
MFPPEKQIKMTIYGSLSKFEKYVKKCFLKITKVSKCMSEIHLHLLQECRQIPWTGGSERELKFQQQTSRTVEKKTKDKQDKQEKQETVSKSVTVSIPNWPYTKNILQELIKYLNK